MKLKKLLCSLFTSAVILSSVTVPVYANDIINSDIHDQNTSTVTIILMDENGNILDNKIDGFMEQDSIGTRATFCCYPNIPKKNLSMEIHIDTGIGYNNCDIYKQTVKECTGCGALELYGSKIYLKSHPH